MILSYERRFLSFACGRTGSTSVERGLAAYDESAAVRERLAGRLRRLRQRTGRRFAVKHVRPELVRGVLSEDLWHWLLKFVFVRNPWDWVLSQHCRHAGGDPPRLGAAGVQAVWDRLRHNNQSLEDESYLQSRFVYGPDGEKLVDVVGRFESLQQDLEGILDRLRLPRFEVPRLNGTRHGPYPEHYTRAGRDRVAELYARDVELLGYRYGG